MEPEPHLRRLATEAAKEARVPVTVADGVAGAIPASDEGFDAAVACLMLCSVPDQARALAEFRRVLRPQGELRFYEHVVADSPGLARAQRIGDRSGRSPSQTAALMARRSAGARRSATDVWLEDPPTGHRSPAIGAKKASPAALPGARSGGEAIATAPPRADGRSRRKAIAARAIAVAVTPSSRRPLLEPGVRRSARVTQDSNQPKESGRVDSNHRSPPPKGGAITRLRYAPCAASIKGVTRAPAGRRATRVPPGGLEPPTCCLEGSCSIQLSYRGSESDGSGPISVVRQGRRQRRS